MERADNRGHMLLHLHVRGVKVTASTLSFPDVYSLLMIFKADLISCFLRQGSEFPASPGTRMNPPRGDKGAMRNLELVSGGRIVLASTFIAPGSSLGCAPPKETG